MQTPVERPLPSFAPQLRRASDSLIKGSIAPQMAKAVAPFELRVQSAGRKVRLPAHNAYVDQAGRPRSYAEPIARFVLNRGAEAQQRVNALLTDAYAGVDKPGQLAKPRKADLVPVNGLVFPVDSAHFDALVASTGPIMRAVRALLQKLYSIPNCSEADLGLEGLDPAVRKRCHEILTRSIYFEPKLVTPAFAEYPFLTIGGFDAAFGDPSERDPVFFECNFGTPAGLGANVALDGLVRKHDPELYATYASSLRPDDTFTNLRRAIESNAKAWTGADGLSVIVGPPRGQPGHSGALVVAELSGMRFAAPSDLWIDAQGCLRLLERDAPPEEHPRITGIYNRAEETYLLQSWGDGIGFRRASFADNARIGERLGVNLEAGVGYQFVRDEAGEIVDVDRDDYGQPRLELPDFSLAPAPGAELPGSLATAIRDRKVYLSNLGGRVGDDKRLFDLVAQHIAPRHAREGEPIAHPPSSLAREDLGEFYAAADLADYVVKAPDRSGGDGVFVLATLDPAECERVREQVRADEGAYLVQRRADPLVVLSVEEANGRPVFGTVTVDGRLLVMLDADGEVRSGSNGLTLRQAAPGGMISNVAQGGGIAPVAVIDAARRRSQTVLALRAGRDAGRSDRLDTLGESSKGGPP